MGDTDKDSNNNPPHPIAEAIDKCLVRVSDIHFGALKGTIAVLKWRVSQMKSTLERLKTLLKASQERQKPEEKMVLFKEIWGCTQQLNRFVHSEIERDLSRGQLLTLFAIFDAYIGDLIAALYRRKPTLFNAINRQMTISEMVSYTNIDDIKEIILESEIDTLRRKGYVELFEDLEKRFSINLRKFDNWPSFVEISQRRNVVAHCDAITTHQYVKICRQEGFAFDPEPVIGKPLTIEPDYFTIACSILTEVAVKLGQTLWRKVIPDEIEEADDHLISVLYDFLERCEWPYAITAGSFALSLPKHFNEVKRTIMLVNYAIAAKFSGQDSLATDLLNSKDWSALSLDFRLAEAVLREDFEKASALMISIGKRGQFVTEEAYHVWPLFNQFRMSNQFVTAYESVYGYSFASQLIKKATDTEKETEQDIKKICADEIISGDESPDCKVTEPNNTVEPKHNSLDP